MENKNNSSEILLKALEDFKSQYPMSTSGDLQTFVIGWNKAVELLSLSTNEEYLENNIVSNSNNDTFKEQEEMFLTLMSELTQISDYWVDNNDYAIIIKNSQNKVITFTNNFCSNFDVSNISRQQIRDFLTIMVEKHLGLTGYSVLQII